MAGRYLATELQDDNGDVIYPHTEADIVFTSDGTTVEENLNGEITSEDINEVFTNTQPQTNNRLSVKEKIKKALKTYQALLRMRILDTVEEVEANTDDGYLMGAKAGAELINDLAQQPEWIKDSTGKIIGYKTPGGADTVFPFINKAFEIVQIYCFSGQTNVAGGYINITLKLTDTSKTGVQWTGSSKRGFSAQSNCILSSADGVYKCAVKDKSLNFQIMSELESSQTAIFNNITAY